MWSTFVDESSTAIFLVSREGIIEYANLPARTLLSGQPAGNVAGKSLAELLGVEHASERLMHIANVLDSNRVVAMEDMLRGKRLQCVLRPAPPAKGEKPTKVVAVAHLSALYAGTQNGYPTVRTRTTDGGRLKDLTAKETEILRLIGAGMSTQEIADTLGRSVKTVEWHRVSLGEKLGVDNRVLLARIAIAAGLVGLDDVSTTSGPRFDAKPAGGSSQAPSTNVTSTAPSNVSVRGKR
jgi:DNA-binding CsgD family transcriptional regulator